MSTDKAPPPRSGSPGATGVARTGTGLAARATTFEPSLVQRAAAGIRYALTGKRPEWFGPGEPLAPAAQDAAEGRAFDYPSGFNTSARPRSSEAISFEQLRGLADNCDLVRLAIETRKKQMARLPWTVRHRTKSADPDEDPTAKQIRELLLKPDGEHSHATWMKMLLEDSFVIDAPAIYVWRLAGGGVYRLEPIDGATIKRVLGPDGRTPPAPAPAYQQFLKGLPAADYTAEELLYRPRNIRTHKVYGYSEVEQIILTVNIAIRRAVHQLEYYTEGNMPEAIIGVPATWTPTQIGKFQVEWDSYFEGNTAQRRKARFVSDGTNVTMLKTEGIFDAGDEWLARVVCYAFDLPPNAFVKQQNRATAANAAEISTQEGLFPLRQWWKDDVMDPIIQTVLGFRDYEYAYQDEEDVDPLVQAQISQIYVTAGILTPDEIRDDMGRPKLTAEQKAELAPPPVVMPGVGGKQGGDEPGGPNGREKTEASAEEGDAGAGAKKLAQLSNHAALLGLHGAAAQKSARRRRRPDRY
jgi:hypothetical protein